MTFAALLVTQKRDKGKVTLCFFAGDQWSPLLSKPQISPKAKIKNIYFPRFFFCHRRRKRKSCKKRKRRNEISRSAERDEDYACPRLGDADTHASHMCQSPDCAAFPKRRAKTLMEGKTSKCMQKSHHRKQNLPAENPQGD